MPTEPLSTTNKEMPESTGEFMSSRAGNLSSSDYTNSTKKNIFNVIYLASKLFIIFLFSSAYSAIITLVSSDFQSFIASRESNTQSITNLINIPPLLILAFLVALILFTYVPLTTSIFTLIGFVVTFQVIHKWFFSQKAPYESVSSSRLNSSRHDYVHIYPNQPCPQQQQPHSNLEPLHLRYDNFIYPLIYYSHLHNLFFFFFFFFFFSR